MNTTVSLYGDPYFIIGFSLNKDAAIDAIKLSYASVISIVSAYSVVSVDSEDTTDIIIVSVLSVENTPLASS